jgi:CheY-like chemotaxis protein
LSRTLGEHIELVVDLAPRPMVVRMDRGQLEQVLVNLAVNARDAMPLGGTLTIEARPSELGSDYAMLNPELRPGKYVQVVVSDTGSGMTRDVLQHAFDPFFTTKPKGEGTGLGLATVYGIVTEAGGTVTLYSEQGLGTTVNLYLPALRSNPSTYEADSGAVTGPGEGRVVLIVEDEEGIRKVAERILGRNGYVVLAASTGAEALELAASHRVDLLLTDVVMPQMSGPELAAQIRAIVPQLPVLYMSGYSRGVLEPQGAVEEGVGLVQKPFTEQVLMQRIEGALHGRVVPRPPEPPSVPDA